VDCRFAGRRVTLHMHMPVEDVPVAAAGGHQRVAAAQINAARGPSALMTERPGSSRRDWVFERVSGVRGRGWERTVRFRRSER
jgi:hypothetical protein